MIGMDDKNLIIFFFFFKFLLPFVNYHCLIQLVYFIVIDINIYRRSYEIKDKVGV